MNDLPRLWQGIPGIERTPRGRLYITWFSGGEREPMPENTIFLTTSDDDGRTFAAPMVLALPRPDGGRTSDPALWIDPRGRLWLIFNRSNRETAAHDVYARICDQPDAARPVWSAEFRVGYDVPFSFRMNKPTVLSTGEWLMPVTHAREVTHDWFARHTQLQGVGCSTDAGRSWKLHGAVVAPPFALENMLVELRDGRVWMLIRTGAGVLWESYSTDRGRTWSPGAPTTIANPEKPASGSRFFIRRLAAGNLLLINHYRFSGRSHLTAQLSTDDGRTWNEGLLLDERANVSYPDAVEAADGLIWAVYDRDRSGAAEILLATFREADVLAGKPVATETRLKQVVNKLRETAA